MISKGVLADIFKLIKQARYLSVSALVFGSVLFYMIFMRNNPISRVPSDPDRAIKENSATVKQQPAKNVTITNTAEPLSAPISNSKDLQQVQIGQTDDSGMELIKPFASKNTVVLPHYTIVRNELISGPFQQGQIYALVNGPASAEALLKVCRTIKKKNGNFNNLVISLFADTELGQKLARGLIRGYEFHTTSKVWLALYTYNNVEGEYFDQNPAAYMGEGFDR